MKKIFLFVAVVSAFSFASCKKDRTCTCTQTDSHGGPAVTYVVVLNKATKGDAKKDCISSTKTDASGVTTTTCSIK